MMLHINELVILFWKIFEVTFRIYAFDFELTHEFEMALMYEELEHLHLGMTGKTIKLYSVNDKTFSLETFLGNYVDLAKEIPISSP